MHEYTTKRINEMEKFLHSVTHVTYNGKRKRYKQYELLFNALFMLFGGVDLVTQLSDDTMDFSQPKSYNYSYIM